MTAEQAQSPAWDSLPLLGWRSELKDTTPDGLDSSVAHPARVYAYWLGGKDHYASDRVVAEEVIRLRPQVVAGVRANRAFLARVVHYLAKDCGIRQFIDIGTGLPAPGATHQVAQRVAPDCRIVYCDYDPLVLVHARALFTGTAEGSCDYVDTDLRDTAAVLAGAARTLDLTRPAALLMLAVLHFIPDADDPAGITATLAGALAPGSYLAISHLTSDFAPGPVTAGISAYNKPGSRRPDPPHTYSGQRNGRGPVPDIPRRRPTHRMAPSRQGSHWPSRHVCRSRTYSSTTGMTGPQVAPPASEGEGAFRLRRIAAELSGAEHCLACHGGVRQS